MRRGKRAVSRSAGAIARPRETMLRGTAGTAPAALAALSLTARSAPAFGHVATDSRHDSLTLCAPRDALLQGTVPQSADPIPAARRGAGSPAPLAAARRRSPGTAAASRPQTGERSGAGLAPSPLRPGSPPAPLLTTSPRLAGKARVAVPRRALTYTDGVGEPRQSLPQQPRQQQQEGPGRALPHFLQPLRFSP